MRIFISYSRVDADFAARLRDAVSDMGHHPWLDVDDIPAGAHWDDSVDRALSRCDAVLGLLSPASVSSDNVKNEWAWALTNQRPLYLLYYEPCTIPHRYVRLNYIDFSQSEAAGLRALGEALSKPYRLYQTTTDEAQVATRVRADGSVAVERVDAATRVAPVQVAEPEIAAAAGRVSALDPRNRRVLLEKVAAFWIRGVLERSLHGAALIELGMRETPDAVDHPWGMVMQTLHWESETLPPGTRLLDVFDEIGRALLILGEPGAGKTTMLLELARDAIARAESEASEPIPVVFNLSSWSQHKKPLHEWLVGELNAKYLVPEKIAQELVKGQELLLLLDGLDEVKHEDREACIGSLNTFRRAYGLTPIAVCSRTADYAALSDQLIMEGAVTIQPLTQEQIDRYLAQGGRRLEGLREALRDDAALQDLVHTPLMLGIATLAYADAAREDLVALDTQEARHRHLFDMYLRRMFERRPSGVRYSKAEMVRWLSWLATCMQRESQMVLLVEGLQPRWLPMLRDRRQYGWGTRIAGAAVGLALYGGLGALIEGLLMGLLAVHTRNFNAAGIYWLGAVMFMGFCGLLIGLIVTGHSARSTITPVEALAWSWKRALYGFLVGLGGGLVGALVSRLLMMGELGVLANFVGLVAGISFGASFGLIGGLGGRRIKAASEPNQGIRQSLRNALFVAASTGFTIGVTTTLAVLAAYIFSGGFEANAWRSLLLPFDIAAAIGAGAGLIVGLLGGFMFGGRVVIQHWTLRLLLARQGLIPRDLVDFLDNAVDHVFMRRVGGGYIFVHRLLLEHFAALHDQTARDV